MSRCKATRIPSAAQREQGDRDRAREQDVVLVVREPGDDRDAKAAGADRSRERRGRDDHHRRGAEAGERERHGERQLDAAQHLDAGVAHPSRRLDRARSACRMPAATLSRTSGIPSSVRPTTAGQNPTEDSAMTRAIAAKVGINRPPIPLAVTRKLPTRPALRAGDAEHESDRAREASGTTESFTCSMTRSQPSLAWNAFHVSARRFTCAPRGATA